MKVKLIGVLVVIAALFVGAVLWRADSFIYGDRMSWVEAQSRTQLSSMTYTLGSELKSLQRSVAAVGAESLKSGKINWSSVAPYFAVATFNVVDQNLRGQDVAVKGGSKAATWDLDFIGAAIGNLEGRTPEMRYYVKPFQDSKGGRYVALVFLEGTKAYALLGAGEIFQSLIDAQKGSINSFSIVTAGGLAVGHSIPEYLGTVMRDDPLFKESRKTGSSHGSYTFKAKGGDLYGMYEAVPRSNLLLLSSAPLTEAMKGRKGLVWQFILLGCGLVLVGAAAILVFGNPAEKQVEILERRLQSLQNRPPIVPEKTKVVLPDLEQVQKDKLQMSMKVASALAHEMRGPLASILGYSQMILAKTTEGEVVDATESILRETRGARVLLDKFLGFAGESDNDKNVMKIEGPLVKACKELEPLFEEKGVKLVKNIQETSAIDLHADALIRALKNILQNSVEAMERMAKKEITLSLFEDTEGIHLHIKDCGEGIEASNIEKIFDPFFTTRSFQNHMGLGLPVAFGVLKEHNAEVRVESQRGQGTLLQILFKKIPTLSVLPAPAQDIPTVPEVEEAAMDLERTEIIVQPETTLKVEEVSAPEEINLDEILDFPEVEASEQDTMLVEPQLEKRGVEMLEVPLESPQSLTVKSKVSKLDSYHVEIRRPGKRS